MSRSHSSKARHLLVTLALVLAVITAGCAGGTETTDDSDSSLERSSENRDVYTDDTATTVVKYPENMQKTIYWEDKTVCTRWNSIQEGGVGCLPFNDTQIDERYDPPSKTSSN